MARVAIFGATSAIATATARIYAERGDRLHLVARNGEKLAAIAGTLVGVPPLTTTADFDRLDDNELVIGRVVESLGGIDVALIAHGDLGDQQESERSFAAAERILRTNFLSVVSLVIPLANAMEAAAGGRLAAMTSVAGERGRPRNYTYGAAKGAVGLYLQGVRSRLHAAGVKVTTLKLGPVDTPMTVDHQKNKLFARPEEVAPDIVRAVDDGVAETFVPWYWRPIMGVVRNTPEGLFQKLPFLSGR